MAKTGRKTGRKKSAERLLREAQAAVNMLESDLSRHRGMLDVDAGTAEVVRDHIVAALALLEPKYRGTTFRVSDVVHFDERINVRIPEIDAWGCSS